MPLIKDFKNLIKALCVPRHRKNYSETSWAALWLSHSQMQYRKPAQLHLHLGFLPCVCSFSIQGSKWLWKSGKYVAAEKIDFEVYLWIPPNRKFIDLPLSNGFNTCFAAQPLPDAGLATQPATSSSQPLGLWVQRLVLGRVSEDELVEFLVSENEKY